MEHTYEVRVFTSDGILELSDTDFAEDARWDWFAETAKQYPDFVVQLLDGDRVLAEELPE